MKQTRNDKSAVHDSISSEALKANIGSRMDLLYSLGCIIINLILPFQCFEASKESFELILQQTMLITFVYILYTALVSLIHATRLLDFRRKKRNIVMAMLWILIPNLFVKDTFPPSCCLLTALRKVIVLTLFRPGGRAFEARANFEDV